MHTAPAGLPPKAGVATLQERGALYESAGPSFRLLHGPALGGVMPLLSYIIWLNRLCCRPCVLPIMHVGVATGHENDWFIECPVFFVTGYSSDFWSQ